MSMSSGITLDERVHLPASALTFEGFRRWVLSDACPEKLRIHFIQGEVFVEMGPEAMETHSKVKGAIYAALATIGDEEDLGEAYPDGVRVTHRRARLSCEPDVTFICFDSIKQGRLKFTPKANRKDDYIEIVGAPDVVVEVISDSSVRKDEKVLREIYAQARVPEFWIVDARKSKIRFEILLLEHGRYRNASPPDEPHRSEVFGRRFTLTRSKNPIGTFIYRLASLP